MSPLSSPSPSRLQVGVFSHADNEAAAPSFALFLPGLFFSFPFLFTPVLIVSLLYPCSLSSLLLSSPILYSCFLSSSSLLPFFHLLSKPLTLSFPLYHSLSSTYVSPCLLSLFFSPHFSSPFFTLLFHSPLSLFPLLSSSLVSHFLLYFLSSNLHFLNPVLLSLYFISVFLLSIALFSSLPTFLSSNLVYSSHFSSLLLYSCFLTFPSLSSPLLSSLSLYFPMLSSFEHNNKS